MGYVARVALTGVLSGVMLAASAGSAHAAEGRFTYALFASPPAAVLNPPAACYVLGSFQTPIVSATNETAAASMMLFATDDCSGEAVKVLWGDESASFGLRQRILSVLVSD